MSNAATHTEEASNHLAYADTLRQDSPASAGELTWLALVQATQACGHRQDPDAHPQSRKGIRNVVGRLPVSNNERARLLDIADLTASNLHGGAYRPADIDDQTHQAEISYAKELIDILLRNAQNGI